MRRPTKWPADRLFHSQLDEDDDDVQQMLQLPQKNEVGRTGVEWAETAAAGRTRTKALMSVFKMCHLPHTLMSSQLRRLSLPVDGQAVVQTPKWQTDKEMQEA